VEVAFQSGTFATVGKGFDDWVKIADDLGLRAMELWLDKGFLWPYSTTKNSRRRYVDALKSHGITPTSISPTPFESKAWREFDFIYNIAALDEKSRLRAVKFYKDIIGIAVEFGAPNVLTLPGKIKESDLMKSDVSYRQAWDRCAKSLKELSKIASDEGVVLGIENAVICNFIDLPEELRQLIDEVGSDHVKVYLDVANANVFRDPEIYIRSLGDVLCTTLHTTDNDGSYPYHLPIGMGTIDYPRILRALKDVGWDGYLLPELFYADDPVGGLRQTKRKLDSIIENLN
jgi:hexulose-6-phosphate isomerase